MDHLSGPYMDVFRWTIAIKLYYENADKLKSIAGTVYFLYIKHEKAQKNNECINW